MVFTVGWDSFCPCHYFRDHSTTRDDDDNTHHFFTRLNHNDYVNYPNDDDEDDDGINTTNNKIIAVTAIQSCGSNPTMFKKTTLPEFVIFETKTPNIINYT